MMEFQRSPKIGFYRFLRMAFDLIDSDWFTVVRVKADGRLQLSQETLQGKMTALSVWTQCLMGSWLEFEEAIVDQYQRFNEDIAEQPITLAAMDKFGDHLWAIGALGMLLGLEQDDFGRSQPMPELDVGRHKFLINEFMTISKRTVRDSNAENFEALADFLIALYRALISYGFDIDQPYTLLKAKNN